MVGMTDRANHTTWAWAWRSGQAMGLMAGLGHAHRSAAMARSMQANLSVSQTSLPLKGGKETVSTQPCTHASEAEVAGAVGGLGR